MTLAEELPEDQRRVLKDPLRRCPDDFTDMPGKTDVMQHQIKMTDSNRVCIDFRKLNKITKVDSEPMTTAEDLFRSPSGKKYMYLSKIDLTKGYWQISVAPEDVQKTVS